MKKITCSIPKLENISFGVWYNFSDSDSTFWDAEKYKFTTLEDAIEFINSEISKTNSPKSKKIIHKYKN